MNSLVTKHHSNPYYNYTVGCVTIINREKLYKEVHRKRNGVNVIEHKEVVMLRCNNCGHEYYVEKYCIEGNSSRPILFKRCRNCTENLKPGDKVGRLTLIRPLSKLIGIKDPKPTKYWLCKCECGNYIETRKSVLRKNKVYSCGKCKDIFHFTRSPFYKRALHILDRTSNPNNKSYPRYGGRGIKCLLGTTPEEVTKSISLIPGYKEGLQLDRIDNDGDYTLEHPIHGKDMYYDEHGNLCVGNLRWVTPQFNSNNKTTNRLNWSQSLIIDLANNFNTEEYIYDLFSERHIMKDLDKFMYIESEDNDGNSLYRMIVYPFNFEYFGNRISEEYKELAKTLYEENCVDLNYELIKTKDIVQRLFLEGSTD